MSVKVEGKGITKVVGTVWKWILAVEEFLERYPVELLPDRLPEDVENVTYHYQYQNTLDSELHLNASWEYEEAQAYEMFRQNLDRYKVLEEYEQDGYEIKKIKPAIGALQEICVGYRDENHAVRFDITGSW